MRTIHGFCSCFGSKTAVKRILVFLLACCTAAMLFACRQPTNTSFSNPASSAVSEQSGTQSSEQSGDAPEESGQDGSDTVCNFTQWDYFEALTYHGDAADVDYLFHEPMRASETPSPLIIFLHGLGDTVNEQQHGLTHPLVTALVALENSSKKYGAYTLVPGTPTAEEGWWTGQQLAAFIDLIRDTIQNYNIDPKRVYIAGISMGGMTACEIVNEMPPETFAAVVTISGVTMIRDPISLKNTAFHINHAAPDRTVSVESSRELHQLLTNAGHPKTIYTEYPIGDHISPLYEVFSGSDNPFYEWLFTQRLP